jgi:hypothetical protein
MIENGKTITFSQLSANVRVWQYRCVLPVGLPIGLPIGTIAMVKFRDPEAQTVQL